ncbi:DUF5977 domain-containing protein [Mucilaginibacter lutimaris]|uniref:DUF5977 domain-containing protein n=1 Tax=Mucilaginibacter lutimaris TaxID=931629 RepID=A0ABW2ZIV9_9SPHI
MQNVEWSFSQSGIYQPTDFGYLTSVSSWLLQEVEDADGNKIKLSYTNDYRGSNGFIADNRTRLTVLPFDSFEQWPGHTSGPYYPVINSVSSENFLTQISADGWKVNFEYDLSPGVLHTLKKVSLLQGNGNLVRQFNLNYTSNDMIALLQSLTETGVTTGAAVTKSHTFTYYDFPSGNYFVRGLDYWGYYNGVNNNTLIPFPPFNADREPNFSYTVMGALKKITYPTGGSSSFEYEPNQYGYLRESTQEEGVTINKKTGGGIRVKRITDTDNSGNPPVVKDYAYDLFSNSNVSSGVALARVNKFFFSFPVTTPSGELQWLFGTPTPDVTHDWNVWKSDPFYSMSLNPVYYFNVRETIGNTIRTDYEFTSHQDYNDNLGYNYGLGDAQVGPYESYDFARSLPKSETNYKNGTPVYKKQITYAVSVKYRARSLWRQILVSSAQGSFQFAKGVPVLSGLVLKTGETITQYDGPNPLTSTTGYEYDSNYYNLRKQTLISSRSTASVPSATETSYTYPFDYTTGVYPAMVSKHMFSPVIEQKVTVDGNQSARKITGYAVFNGAQYKQSLIQTQTGSSGPVITNTEITKYTPGGNVLEYKRNEQSFHAYKWGYHDQYPVAEVINAQTTEFYSEDFENINNAAVAGGQGTAHTGTRYTTDPVIKWTKPNSRNYKISYWFKSVDGWKYSGELSYGGPTYTMSGGSGYDDVSIYPADAQLSNYTYRPLVGMTASINTNRQINYYEYDSFQRLMNIKDLNGNIIKNFCYNYQNQGTDCFNPPVLYYNTDQYQGFSKYCGTQANGSIVTYKVPAGSFYSLISVDEANQRALAEINANGQMQADNDPTATCTVLQCYNYTLSANQGFSTTYQWKNCNGVTQSAHLDVGQTTSVCALEGTVTGGPYTKGAICAQ